MKRNFIKKTISAVMGAATLVGLTPVNSFAEELKPQSETSIVQEQVESSNTTINDISTSNVESTPTSVVAESTKETATVSNAVSISEENSENKTVTETNSTTDVDSNSNVLQAPGEQNGVNNAATPEVKEQVPVVVENPVTIIELNGVSIDFSQFAATNLTTETEIINFVKNQIDSSVVVKIERFKKAEASAASQGEITGTLVLSTESDSKQVPVKLAIAKLEEKEVQVKEPVVEETQSSTTTTDAAVNITTPVAKTDTTNINEVTPIVTPQPQIEQPVIPVVQPVQQEVTKLDIKVEGEIEVDNIISVKVTGYNANNEIAALDPSKEEDIWVVEKNIDGRKVNEVIGEGKTLKITDELKGKKISCKVRYDEPKEGGIK